MDKRRYYEDMLLPEEYARLRRFDTVAELMDYTRSEFSDKTAVCANGFSATYAQLYDGVARLRGGLTGMGVNAGDRVGVLAANGYGFIASFLAITTLGAIAVLLNPALPAPAIAGCVKKCDISLILCEQGLRKTVEDSACGVSCAQIDEVSGEAAPACAALTKDTPAAVVFSGGTTGRPKAALLSHGALLLGAYNGSLAWRNTFYERYVAIIPFTHVFGLVRDVLTPMLTGSSVYTFTNMKLLPQALMEAKPTILVLVPALADMLFKLSKLYGAALFGGELRSIIAGGAPVSEKTVKNYASLGIKVLPGYGLTETANLVSGNGDADTKPTSVGVPYPDQELRIVEGELWVKGDHVMQCYYNDPDETDSAMEHGWFKTGDLARFDGDGFLYITGRKKNIIVRENGENVSPEELEALVNAEPVISDALVYETEGAMGERVLTVEVFPDENALKAMGITDARSAAEEAVARVNAKLPEYRRMNRTVVRDTDFERSPSMKIVRK